MLNLNNKFKTNVIFKTFLANKNNHDIYVYYELQLLIRINLSILIKKTMKINGNSFNIYSKYTPAVSINIFILLFCFILYNIYIIYVHSKIQFKALQINRSDYFAHCFIPSHLLVTRLKSMQNIRTSFLSIIV